jgi:uncharacterized protein YndB with AHSA1/START domain
MQQWFAPGGMRVASARADLRVGGEYRVEMHGLDDAVYVASGFYRTIVPNELLSFTWGGRLRIRRGDIGNSRVA